MFDLELNINSWCDYLRNSGKMAEDDVIELEDHLREQIDEFIEKGLEEDEAFLISIKRLGNVHQISEEYSKINTDTLWKHLMVDTINPEAKNRTHRDILMVVILSILAGTVAKIPALLGINIEDLAYIKNLSLYFYLLLLYFLQ